MPYAADLRHHLDQLGTLRLTPDEATFLRSVRFIKSTFVDLRECFGLDPAQISITITTDGGLGLRVVAPWLSTILF